MMTTTNISNVSNKPNPPVVRTVGDMRKLLAASNLPDDAEFNVYSGSVESYVCFHVSEDEDTNGLTVFAEN